MTLDATPPDLLAQANAHAQAVVRTAVGGPLVDIALEPLQSPGKGVRARLVAEVGRVLGVPESLLVAPAAAAELLHNASLIHDDVQDGDTVRRGAPTIWARHGVAQAINAGDLLLMVAVAAFDVPELSPTVRWQLARAAMRRSAATVGGQALELALSHHADIPPSLALYERAAIGKTGHFFALPVELAALVAGLESAEAEALGDAALPLGLIYQIADDVLDLYGDKGRGSRGNDVREGKVSALVALHLELRPADRYWLTAVLRKPRDLTSDADIDRVAAAFLASGAVAAAARSAQTHRDALRLTGGRPEVLDVLGRVADRLVAPLSRLAVGDVRAAAPTHSQERHVR